ncbi:hypothetical protein ACIBSV_29150 [Embleya sp. NPDC050154]|uniref:hypothetical protein n=1 Tax=Embleya sp. NPDC050154 TaxID=3363988 RepID=UPI0037918A48
MFTVNKRGVIAIPVPDEAPKREPPEPALRAPLRPDEWVQPLPGTGLHQPPGQVVTVADSPGLHDDQVVMVQVGGRGSRGIPYLLEASKLHRVDPSR